MTAARRASSMVQVAATGDYERDGFVILRAPLIPPSTIDKANADIDRVLAEQDQALHPSIAEGGTVVLSKSSDDLVACAGVRELLRHPALEEWARKVTGATRPRVRTPSPTTPPPRPHSPPLSHDGRRCGGCSTSAKTRRRRTAGSSASIRIGRTGPIPASGPLVIRTEAAGVAPASARAGLR